MSIPSSGPTNFSDLNLYKTLTEAEKNIHSIVNNTSKKNLTAAGISDKKANSILQNRLKGVIANIVKNVSNNSKEIKSLTKSVKYHQDKIAKLDSKIAKLAKGNKSDKTAKELKKLETEKKSNQLFLDGVKQELMDRKEKWKEENQSLANLVNAVKGTSTKTSIHNTLGKLTAVEAKMSKQIAALHVEKEWELVDSVRQRLNYYTKMQIIDYATSPGLPKLSQTAYRQLEKDSAALQQFMAETEQNDKTKPAFEQAIRLNYQIDQLLRSQSPVQGEKTKGKERLADDEYTLKL